MSLHYQQYFHIQFVRDDVSYASFFKIINT